MRKTQVAVQSRGLGKNLLPTTACYSLPLSATAYSACYCRHSPGGNLPPAGQPRHMRMRVAVCLHMQTNGINTIF